MSSLRDRGVTLSHTIDKVLGTQFETRLLSGVGLSILLSSCCSPGVRPEDANLFQASCAIMSGEYDRQLENDRRQAKESRRAVETEEYKSVELQTDLEAKKAERRRLALELDELKKENRRLEAHIRTMRADSANAEQERITRLRELRRIQDEVEIIQRQATVEQDAADQYRAEVSRLKQEIDLLRALISAQ